MLDRTGHPLAAGQIDRQSARMRPALVKIGNSIGLGGTGGAEGNRTPDLVIANDALSQLSYGPVSGYPV